jgi:hypothetical protein
MPLIERCSGKVAGSTTLSAHCIPLNDLATELDKKLSRNPSVPVGLIGWMGGTWPAEGQGSAALRNGSAAYSNIPESAIEVLGKKHFTWRYNYKFFVPASQGPSRPAERCVATATWGYRVQ